MCGSMGGEAVDRSSNCVHLGATLGGCYSLVVAQVDLIIRPSTYVSSQVYKKGTGSTDMVMGKGRGMRSMPVAALSRREEEELAWLRKHDDLHELVGHLLQVTSWVLTGHLLQRRVTAPALGLVMAPALGLVVVPALGLGLVMAPAMGLVMAPALGLVMAPAQGLVMVPALGLVMVPALGLVMGSGADGHGMLNCAQGVCGALASCHDLLLLNMSCGLYAT